MEVQILNDMQMEVTPNNFTEYYAIQEFLKKNKDVTFGDLLIVEDSGLWTNE